MHEKSCDFMETKIKIHITTHTRARILSPFSMEAESHTALDYIVQLAKRHAHVIPIANHSIFNRRNRRTRRIYCRTLWRPDSCIASILSLRFAADGCDIDCDSAIRSHRVDDSFADGRLWTWEREEKRMKENQIRRVKRRQRSSTNKAKRME